MLSNEPGPVRALYRLALHAAGSVHASLESGMTAVAGHTASLGPPVMRRVQVQRRDEIPNYLQRHQVQAGSDRLGPGPRLAGNTSVRRRLECST